MKGSLCVCYAFETVACSGMKVTLCCVCLLPPPRSVVDREAWLTSLTHIMTCCASTSQWLLDMLSVQPGSTSLKVFLLECPSSEMRFLFAKLLLTALQKYFDHGGDEKDVVDRIIEHLLNLLQHEVVDCYRFSTQYFDFLREYSSHVSTVAPTSDLLYCALCFGPETFCIC